MLMISVTFRATDFSIYEFNLNLISHFAKQYGGRLVRSILCTTDNALPATYGEATFDFVQPPADVRCADPKEFARKVTEVGNVLHASARDYGIFKKGRIADGNET
jgi:hypothetical protein